MDISLISGITNFCNHYLVISGISGSKTVSVLKPNLEVVDEFPIEGISVWGHDFHIQENTKTVLISIITTETVKDELFSYQGFSTHWYLLSLLDGAFKFEKQESWENVDILGIKSHAAKGDRNWIALAFSNVKGRDGNSQKYSHFRLGKGADDSSVPQINQFLLQSTRPQLKHVFDFLHDEDTTYLSFVEGSDDRCGVIKINSATQKTTVQFLDVPLLKGHEYRSIRLVNLQNGTFAYIWTIANDSTRKFKFELYRSGNLEIERTNQITKRIVDSDRVVLTGWNPPFLAYTESGNNSDDCIIAKLDDDGEALQLKKIENWRAIHFGLDSTMICIDKDNKQLSLIPIDSNGL